MVCARPNVFALFFAIYSGKRTVAHLRCKNFWTLYVADWEKQSGNVKTLVASYLYQPKLPTKKCNTRFFCVIHVVLQIPCVIQTKLPH